MHQQTTFSNNKLGVNKIKYRYLTLKVTILQKQVKINNNLLIFTVIREGVRYKLGGTSKNGIDCSGFVQKALKEKFNLNLPRSTGEQAQIGKSINKNELQMGDLVFSSRQEELIMLVYILKMVSLCMHQQNRSYYF